MTDRDRIVVIGAGHNGLVCAAYLARTGREVLVLEAADQTGGMAMTREFAPGFRASVAHLLYLLDDSIAKELVLERHGLEMACDRVDSIALGEDGKHLALSASGVEGSGLGAADRNAYVEYRRLMTKLAGFVGTLNGRLPARITDRPRELFELGKLALRLRLLGRDDMREFLRIAAINIHDVLEEQFDNPLLKGALGLDAVLGGFAGPRSNNTVFAALHRMSGSRAGVPGIPRGGMGTVTDALAASARAAGAEIRLGARVRRITSDDLSVSGIELEGGERIEATTVVSNADPQTTVLGLLGARHVETEYARRFTNFRSRGYAAKLHLALDGLPVFAGLDTDRTGHRLLIAPDLDYVDRAFNPCKYGEFSTRPVLEITVPSLHDPTLAPEGKHLLSAVVQYAPYELKSGWDSGREAFFEAILDTLSRYAPGIRQQVVASELLLPRDLEQRFGLTGGHWHHGELSLDQALMLRPVPHAARYRMPIEGLFLCGAGAHPGGGVMGHAGRNAARAILAGDAS